MGPTALLGFHFFSFFFFFGGAFNIVISSIKSIYFSFRCWAFGNGKLMRLLNVHLLKIGVAKMKCKVIKTRQLKIIFWGIKPLSWAPINASSSSFFFFFFFTSSPSSFIYFCASVSQRQNLSRSYCSTQVSVIHHSDSSTNQLSLQLLEAGGTGARSDSNKAALKN